jgi:anti-sigma B factor antagonist
MRIQRRVVGEVVIIDLSGRLTLGGGDEHLRDEISRLIQEGQTKIVLNLADVLYMDTTCLGEVVRTYVTTTRRGGGLKLLRPTERVRDLLKIAGISKILEAFESEEDAVRSFLPSTGA